MPLFEKKQTPSAGSVSSQYQPALRSRNNYAPYHTAIHPHELYRFPNLNAEREAIQDAAQETETPISGAKAKLHIGAFSYWEPPSLLGLILMAKPKGPERPHWFPKHESGEQYKPRRSSLSAAYRTVWRFGKSENPEKLVAHIPKPLVHQPTSSSLQSQSTIQSTPEETELEEAVEHEQRPSTDVHRASILPRGLIIPCKIQNDPYYQERGAKFGFHGGFPYPRAVMKQYGIQESDWKEFCEALHKIVRPYATDAPWFGGLKKHGVHGAHIPELIDSILDVVAEWDSSYFRPKGLLMRMDTPGEAIFGLTTMDVWHRGFFMNWHIDNCHGLLSQKVLQFETGKPKGTTLRLRHLSHVLEKAFSSTRIVLDDIKVLEDTKRAYERGWMIWNASCHWARELKSIPKKFAFGMPAARADRWPRSKHIYYDRFVGHYMCTAMEITERLPVVETRMVTTFDLQTKHRKTEYKQVVAHYTDAKRINPHGSCTWHPEQHSMDQRRATFATRTVLPADCAPVKIKSHFDDRMKSFETNLYWRMWALEILEMDGYYEKHHPRIGKVYRKPASRQVKKPGKAYDKR